MGGFGSGNRYHYWRSSKKTTVEECLCLNASAWMRAGILRAGVGRVGSWVWTYQSGKQFPIYYAVETSDKAEPLVRLSYSWTWNGSGPTESASYTVHLTTTRPQFGGLRWWFLCPLTVNGRPCNRRVGKLYLPTPARYFGCRHCHDLTYTSCQESHQFDALNRHIADNMGVDFELFRRRMNRLGK